jgi:hypothetical protein
MRLVRRIRYRRVNPLERAALIGRGLEMPFLTKWPRARVEDPWRTTIVIGAFLGVWGGFSFVLLQLSPSGRSASFWCAGASSLGLVLCLTTLAVGGLLRKPGGVEEPGTTKASSVECGALNLRTDRAHPLGSRSRSPHRRNRKSH